MARAPVITGIGGLGPLGEPEQPAEDAGARLILCWDALSLWCFGFIPAMRHLISIVPAMPVRILPCGLYRGAPVLRYSDELDVIREISIEMQAQTGRAVREPLWTLIQDVDPPLRSSVPALAVLRLQQVSPDNALDFAHHVQEAHFLEGADLNDPETYRGLLQRFVLPEIALDDLAEADEDTPLVEAAYANAEERGITQFPTLILEIDGREAGRVEAVFYPALLEQRVKALLA